MPSKSKSQQRLMGWALSCLRGEQTNCPTNIKKVGDSFIKKGKKKGIKNLRDFAGTKHKGLPERKKKNENVEIILKFKNFLNEINSNPDITISDLDKRDRDINLLSTELNEMVDFIEWLFEDSGEIEHISQREAWEKFKKNNEVLKK